MTRVCVGLLSVLSSNSEPEPDLCAELTKHEKYDEGVVRKYVGEIWQRMLSDAPWWQESVAPRVWVISRNLRLETKSRENILSPSLSPSSPYVVSRDLSVLSIEQMIAASYKPSFLW